MVYSLIDHRNDVKMFKTQVEPPAAGVLQSFELLMSFLWSIIVPTMKNCRLFFSITLTSISVVVSWEIMTCRAGLAGIFIYYLFVFILFWRKLRGTLIAAAIFKAMSKMEAIVSSFALQNTPTLQFTIGEALSSNGITSENKTNCILPHPVHWSLGCFLFSTGSSNSGTTLHGGGRGGKDLFSPF